MVKMRKIGVVTATRAEYGLLAPVIRELRKYEKYEEEADSPADTVRVELIVTGTHLSEAYGLTVREIEQDGLRIDHRISIPVVSEREEDISSNQAQALTAFTSLFVRERYSAVLLLGDRYEMLSVAIAAGNTRTPVFHLCGGDTTEGALDEWIRHAITKISYLHFVTNEESRRRVIQLGEAPDRVFNYGSTSIDNILRITDQAGMSREQALQSIGLPDCDYALCTYHPVTMEGTRQGDAQIAAFLEAVRSFPELTFIVTKSNADQGGARINELLDEADKEIPNLHVFTSLGVRRYLSLMKHAEFVLGNSSSGIIEAPAFGIPTVNIGDRQRGRLQSESIVNCASDTESIMHAVEIACSREHREKSKKVISPYGAGDAGIKTAAKILETLQNGEIDLKKRFYDLPSFVS